MGNDKEIYQKYFGLKLSQDLFKAIAIRAFCEVANGLDRTGVGFKTIDPEMMKAYLDDTYYRTWMALRDEWLASVR